MRKTLSCSFSCLVLIREALAVPLNYIITLWHRYRVSILQMQALFANPSLRTRLDQKPKIAEYKVSFSDDDYDKALKSTYFWRATMIKNVFDLDISDLSFSKRPSERRLTRNWKKSIDIIASIEDSISSIEESTFGQALA